MEKNILRKLHMTEIARQSEEKIRSADCKILENILQLKEYQDAKAVFLYVSVGREVDTRALLRHALREGKRVYIPFCEGKGVMHAARLTDESCLLPGRYGIPTVCAENQRAAPEEHDFILVPGVCFDRAGNRLGRGGGYYDRYLAQETWAARVGVCRSAQLLEALPVGTHDRGVSAVVTEREIVYSSTR